jgi:hypothetical protein
MGVVTGSIVTVLAHLMEGMAGIKRTARIKRATRTK